MPERACVLRIHLWLQLLERFPCAVCKELRVLVSLLRDQRANSFWCFASGWGLVLSNSGSQVSRVILAAGGINRWLVVTVIGDLCGGSLWEAWKCRQVQDSGPLCDNERD